MLIKKEHDEYVTTCLVHLYAYTKLQNASSLTDINTYLEDFFCDLFNLLYDYNLKNLNIEVMNYPAVDLGDKQKRIAIQVTSQSGRDKILNTIEKFEKHQLYNEYDALKLFLIDLKVPSYRKSFETTFFKFTKNDNIFCLKELIGEISKSKHKTKIVEFLKENISKISDNTENMFQTKEEIIFKALFSEISDYQRDAEKEGDVALQNNSDLETKAKRFSKYWNYIQDLYVQVMTTAKERLFARILGSFDDTESLLLKEYLSTQSNYFLLKNDNDPIASIEALTMHLINFFKLTYISLQDVKYFLLFMFINCDVFPNKESV
jgi:hypothetical protein